MSDSQAHAQNASSSSDIGPVAARRVLIVDDDPVVGSSLAEYLSREGYEVAVAADAEAALETLPHRDFEVVLCDISMPGMGGMALLREIRRRRIAAAVVMLTGYGSIESAVEALRLGASDYLVKPVVDRELRVSIERAVQQQALLAENRQLRRRLDERPGVTSRTGDRLGGVIGSDSRMAKVFEIVEAVAASRTTVLMTGESGTGKSMIAHAIHNLGPRRDKPFVEISCGSIPETLLESELFGHVKGAFTGAHADKVGRFLAANEGTIFLDEINSAPPAMQLKLLRVLQERKFEPVGSSQTIEVNVRVILASNQPLEQLVASGHFRQDLYYRINVVKIELPPLRDRPADIRELAEHFLSKHAAELGRQITGFTPEALAKLTSYSYPGNIRELQNIVERAAVLTRGQTIGAGDLPPHVAEPTSSTPAVMADPGSGSPAATEAQAWIPMPLEEALREPERQIILRALRANQWNRQKTADQLAINRTTLYKKMKSLGLEADSRLAG